VAIATGDDVAVAGKNMGFDELQFAFMANRRVDNNKQRIAKGFKLGPAVFLKGVFDGQFMQVELALQVAQLLRVGLLQTNPDEVTGLFGPLYAFVQSDSGDFLACVVNRSSNNSPHSSNRFFFKGLWHEYAA